MSAIEENRQRRGAPRVDIFSLKGGVGKTTLAILLARAQSTATGRPVLIVDADFTGTCLGDLLEFWRRPAWHRHFNLSHLVCGRPEQLQEALKNKQQVPLFVYQKESPTSGSLGPLRLASTNGLGAEVLFCPSHIESTGDGLPGVDPAVLIALLGNETAGGWVRHVIEQVIVCAEALATGLGGVIVDHSPGMSSLQTAMREDLERELERSSKPSGASEPWGSPSQHRLLFVTSRDVVDLASADSFQAAFGPELRDATCWLVNQVDPAAADLSEWQSKLGNHVPKDLRQRRWLAEAFPFFEDSQMAAIYAKGACLSAGDLNRTSLEAVRAKLFDRHGHRTP